MGNTTTHAPSATTSDLIYRQQHKAAVTGYRARMAQKLRQKFTRAARIMSAVGISAAVVGTNLAYGDPIHAKETGLKAWDFAFSWLPDGNLKIVNTHKSDGDKRGDRKQIQMVARNLDNGLVLGLNSGLITPQGRVTDTAADKVKWRDTGFSEIVAGYETSNEKYAPEYGIYAHLGVINGPVNDMWQDMVAKIHGGHARTSKASSAIMPYLGVSARVDDAFKLAQLGDTATLDFNGAAFANITTMDISGGLAAYVSLNFSEDSTFKPTLPGMPMQSNSRSTSLYAGVIAQAFAYDRQTDALGTEPFRATAVAGATLNFENIGLGVEYQRPLMNETINGYKKPIDRGMAFLRVKF